MLLKTNVGCNRQSKHAFEIRRHKMNKFFKTRLKKIKIIQEIKFMLKFIFKYFVFGLLNLKLLFYFL